MHVPPSKIVEYLLQDVPIIACGDGPWRSDPRCPPGDAAESLAKLKKGDRAPHGHLRPDDADRAARTLIALIENA
jgi:hypothetical protein